MWRAYATHKTPHATPLPAPFHASLNSFQKLLVLRALREEKTVFAVRQFVLQQLGPAFTEPPPFDLEVGHQLCVFVPLPSTMYRKRAGSAHSKRH